MKEIGARLAQARKKLGLNQAEMAKLLGLTQSAVSHMESTGSITPENMNVISKNYNINMNWLSTGVGKMFNGEDSAEQSGVNEPQVEYLKQVIEAKDEVIASLKDQIELLKSTSK